MKNIIKKKITVLLALLVAIIFSVCTAYAEIGSKFAPGIEGVAVDTQGAESTVTLTIADDAKLSGDVYLIAVARDKSQGK